MLVRYGCGSGEPPLSVGGRGLCLIGIRVYQIIGLRICKLFSQGTLVSCDGPFRERCGALPRRLRVGPRGIVAKHRIEPYRTEGSRSGRMVRQGRIPPAVNRSSSNQWRLRRFLPPDANTVHLGGTDRTDHRFSWSVIPHKREAG